MEVLGEPPDRTDVGKCGSLRVITALEFLEHPFAKLGHRDLLVTQTYLLAASDASPCHHAQRPPRERLSSNGVVGNLTPTCPRQGDSGAPARGAVSNRTISYPNHSLSVHLPGSILDFPDAAHTAHIGPRYGPALWRFRPDSHARAHPDLAGGPGARQGRQPTTALRRYLRAHRARRQGAGQSRPPAQSQLGERLRLHR